MHAALGDVQIRKEAVSELLLELGVDLTGELTPSIVLGATDVLLLAELARSLPLESDYPAVISLMHTFSTEQPAEVRNAQRLVVQSIFASNMSQSGLMTERLNHLLEIA
jgi:hypothetical protein